MALRSALGPWRFVIGTAGIAGVTKLSIDHSNDHSETGIVTAALSQLDGGVRFTRTVGIALWTGADFKYSLRGTERGTPAYKEALSLANKRAADRVLLLCNMHGGIYTKLGQYIGTLNPVLPIEITATLAPLTDRAKGMSAEDAKMVVDRETENLRKSREMNRNIETGDDLETENELVRIEPHPIAAASIAQVHRGTLRDGTVVAVKLQYPWLARQLKGDLESLATVATIVETFFPGLGYGWLLKEFKTNLLLELNFMQEAANATRMARMFKNDKKVCVPQVYWEQCTPRMLTMQFQEGVKPNNAAALASHKISPASVAREVTRVFADMIHVHGFVHCDPHSGNLLVVPDSNARDGFRLAVLDHGMYRRLTPTFRAGYCQLWQAMLTRDAAAGAEAVHALGVSEDLAPAERTFDALSLIMTYRGANSKTQFGNKMSKEERAETKARFEGTQAKDISFFLESLPRDILFVLRTMSIVRSLNAQLGGTSRERFHTIGLSAVRGIQVTTLSDNHRKGKTSSSSSERPWFELLSKSVSSDAALADLLRHETAATADVNLAVASEELQWHNAQNTSAVVRWWTDTRTEAASIRAVWGLRFRLWIIDVVFAASQVIKSVQGS